MDETISYKDMSTLIERGNENAEVPDLVVQEFNNQWNLRYTWLSADHFDIFDGNENSPFLDYTEAQLDYIHANSITIDSDTRFLISCRYMDQITKVDRRSGAIMWNLGGKHNDFTFINDAIGFSHQHSISKLDNGDLLLFDNGNLYEEQTSTSIVYRLDEINKAEELVLTGFSAHKDNFDISSEFPNHNPVGENKTIEVRFKGNQVNKGV